MTPDLSEARRLLGMGLKLVELKPYSKQPVGLEWNKHPVTEINPEATGYGVILEQNKLCSLDPDNWPLAKRGMAALGFDLDALMDLGVRTRSTRPGSGGRSAFAAEGDLEWIKFRSKSTGTVIEFRATSPNLQDCIPGLIYRDPTGRLCRHEYSNCKRLDDAPALPDELLAWWVRCSTDLEFLHEQERRFFAALETAPQHSLSTGKGKTLAYPAPYHRTAYNAAHTVEEHLERHGYKYDRRLKRWAPPTATGEPGVRPIPGRDGLWYSDHASDPLSGMFDAWIACVVLDHDGNVEAAKRAAEAEGLVMAMDPRELMPPDGEPPAEGVIRKQAEKQPLLATALQAALEATTSEWLLRPYLETDVLALMYGDYGTLKSFLALDWCMRIALGLPALGQPYAREPRPVVYISAEGKGLWKRLRAWCIHNCPDEDWQDVLGRAQLYVIRRPVNLSAEQEILHLVTEIDGLGIAPGLVVVDTLSRNSNGEPEKSTDAATTYLNLIDIGIRVRYRASVLFIHHVGHGDKERHRGPIVLAANTDAEFRITRPSRDRLEIILGVVRLKDSENPDEIGLAGTVIDLGGADEDGKPITSLALNCMDQPPSRPDMGPSGKNQATLLKAIDEHVKATGSAIVDSITLRQLCSAAGINRKRYIEALSGLDRAGYLKPCPGGYIYAK